MQGFRKLLADRAGSDVGGAAGGGERHDDLDRL